MADRFQAERGDARSLSRRSFLKGAGGLAVGGALGAAAEAGREASAAGAVRLAGVRALALTINGEERRLEVEPRTTLLSALRTRLDPPLTGAKEVCDRGACGACTVLVDDKPVYACMQLAVDCAGRRVRTVEGLGSPGALSAVQEAFWKRDALMCGFCTPGFVVSVTACLEREPHVDEGVVRKACSGNLCRCGTYPHVFEAAREAKAALDRGGER